MAPPFLALWRASEHAFWSKAVDRLRRDAIRPARSILKFSPMETRKSFLGWYQPWIGHPPFSYQPFHDEKSLATLRGPGPASLNSATGRRIVPSKSGAPFGTGTLFLRPVRCPGWNELTRRSAVNSGNSRNRNGSRRDVRQPPLALD